MFRDKQIADLLENIYKELKQIKLMFKNNILKGVSPKTDKGGMNNNG